MQKVTTLGTLLLDISPMPTGALSKKFQTKIPRNATFVSVSDPTRKYSRVAISETSVHLRKYFNVRPHALPHVIDILVCPIPRVATKAQVSSLLNPTLLQTTYISLRAIPALILRVRGLNSARVTTILTVISPYSGLTVTHTITSN